MVVYSKRRCVIGRGRGNVYQLLCESPRVLSWTGWLQRTPELPFSRSRAKIFVNWMICEVMSEGPTSRSWQASSRPVLIACSIYRTILARLRFVYS
eukprot:COSAG01_NODE_2179_length_8215_cov_8.332553_3_plen_96_part_00